MARIVLLSSLILIGGFGDAILYAQQPETRIAEGPRAARARELNELAFSKSPEAGAKIKQALSDEDWYVRGAAARAIGRLGDKTNGSLLVPLLRDPNWFVRSAAIEAIGALGAGASITPNADSNSDIFFRAGVLKTSGTLASESRTEILIKSLSDKEPLVRRLAASALGFLKASGAVKPLIDLLKDEDESVRKAAVVALGRIGDSNALSVVQTASSEAADADRWEYAAALYRLGGTDRLESLVAALKSEYRDVRSAVLKTLLEFADDRVLPAVISLGREASGSSENDVFVRAEIASGLTRFKGQESRAALINMLEDQAPLVRSTAVSSIAQLCKAEQPGEFTDRALAALVLTLKREDSPAAIESINQALAIFDHSRVTDMLLESRTSDGKFGPNIEKALAAAGLTIEAQAAQVSTGDVADRIRAIDRLAKLGDSRAVLPLVDAMSTAKELEVRVKAADALGSLRDRRGVESLITASGSLQKELRVAAVRSLGLIGDHLAAEALFAAVRDGDPAVRDAAVASLSSLGISSEKVAPDLSSSSWQVRAAAVTTLARLGDRKSVPLLISALRDSDSRVRSEAARTLGQFNEQSVTDALIGALRDQSADVRTEATFALGKLKDERALSPLASLLNDRDPRVSLAAAESLARLRDPRATRVLIDSLSSTDWRVRSRATQVLARVATEGSLDQAVTPLGRALADDDPVVRYYAAEALAGLGSRSIPILIEGLRSHREADRDRAARVLWRIGAPSVDPLILVLQERNASAETRASAAQTLGLIAEPRSIKALAALLSDERYFVRQQAARALGQLGEPALDVLFEMAKSSTPAIREAAVEAMGASNTPKAIDRVIEALSDSNLNVRAAAVRALGESSSDRAVPQLLLLLRDETSTYRAQAAASLAKLGPVAVPGLIKALRDSKPSVRQLSAEALGVIGSKDAVPALIELVRSDQSGARPEAIEALGKIGDPAAVDPILTAIRAGSVAVRKRGIVALSRLRDSRVQDALVGALTDTNEEVRQSAAAGLGEIGDERIIPRLERIADNDKSSDVRTAAVQAIERIRKDQKTRSKASDPRISRP